MRPGRNSTWVEIARAECRETGPPSLNRYLARMIRACFVSPLVFHACSNCSLTRANIPLGEEEIEEKERGGRERERERSGISWHAISKWYDEYRRAHLGRLTFLQRWFFFLVSLGGMSVTKKKKKKASIEDYARSVYACSWITVEFDLEFINNRWKVKMKFGWLDLKINVFLSSWFPIQQYIGIDE